MPTLDELRRMLSRGIGNIKPRDIGEGAPWDVEGEADHLDEFTEEMLSDLTKTGVDVAKMKAARSAPKSSPPKYAKSVDGRDAIIKFGKHRDKALSDIYKEDPSYLGWLLKEFRGLSDPASKDFVDIVKHIIEKAP